MKANIFESNTILKKAKYKFAVSFLFKVEILDREH